MPDDVQANGTEVSDAMSEKEYDDTDHPPKSEDGDDQMAVQTEPEQAEVKKKYDPKDPNRPRRKKARRACFACQRAHLTCGDERPCQRCIKRGLAEACQDGVRKKAKYLHDAPAEALRPVLGPCRASAGAGAGTSTGATAVTKQANGRQVSSASDLSPSFYPTTSTPQSYATYPSRPAVTTVPESLSFAGQSSPVSPSYPQHGQPQGMQMAQGPGEMNAFPTAMFDPSNPSLFNFGGLEGFGSHYGAAEFGMLGHMSSGAAQTPLTPRERPLSQPATSDVHYGGPMYSDGMGQYDQLYDNGIMDSYMNTDPNIMYSHGNLQHGLPYAYAVAAAGPTPTSLASPVTDNTASPQPTSYRFDGSPTMAAFTTPRHMAPQHSRPKARPRNSDKDNNNNGNKTNDLGPGASKRRREPSSIYESVTEPYQYLTAFHNLTALVKRRFSNTNTLRIAKSLASIRPSFISCTRNLTREDLIFMEKCLQRTLLEYDDFMGHTPAPSIVCRRTGEVAAVNKEFVALTGWTQDVLLGYEPNLNVNTGESLGSAGSSSNKTGLSTPNLRTNQPDMTNQAPSPDGKPQAVFLAELMDDDSVIEFYEDFAQLAFGDSRGQVTRQCRLLKYRDGRDVAAIADGGSSCRAGDTPSTSPPQPQPQPQKKDPRGILSNRVTRIDGEHGISRLQRDGKVDCSCTWTIKRDMFDIPMLVVMNFLPCYSRSRDQLAV